MTNSHITIPFNFSLRIVLIVLIICCSMPERWSGGETNRLMFVGVWLKRAKLSGSEVRAAKTNRGRATEESFRFWRVNHPHL
jgi:hypothetical protein